MLQLFLSPTPTDFLGGKLGRGLPRDILIEVKNNICKISPSSFHYVSNEQYFFVFRYGKASFSFSNLIHGITRRFSSEFELQEVCWPHSHNRTEMHTVSP